MPTERAVTSVIVKMSSYARDVSPAMRPEPLSDSTPRPSWRPMMSVIWYRVSPSSSTLVVRTLLSPLLLSSPSFSGVRYRYLKPFSGREASIHATLNWSTSSSAMPRRAPELADR